MVKEEAVTSSDMALNNFNMSLKLLLFYFDRLPNRSISGNFMTNKKM